MLLFQEVWVLLNFTDAITTRGQKHINELLRAKKRGYEIYIFFMLFSEMIANTFKLAKDIDPNYSELLIKAVEKILNVLCYDCKFSSKGIKINRKIIFNDKDYSEAFEKN